MVVPTVIITPNLTVASVSHRRRKLPPFYPEGTAFRAHRVCSRSHSGTELAAFVQSQDLITRKMDRLSWSVRAMDRGAQLNCRWDPGLRSPWGLKSQETPESWQLSLMRSPAAECSPPQLSPLRFRAFVQSSRAGHLGKNVQALERLCLRPGLGAPLRAPRPSCGLTRPPGPDPHAGPQSSANEMENLPSHYTPQIG